MYAIQEKVHILQAMEKVKGKSIEQLTVAMIVRDFESG